MLYTHTQLWSLSILLLERISHYNAKILGSTQNDIRKESHSPCNQKQLRNHPLMKGARSGYKTVYNQNMLASLLAASLASSLCLVGVTRTD